MNANGFLFDHFGLELWLFDTSTVCRIRTMVICDYFWWQPTDVTEIYRIRLDVVS